MELNMEKIQERKAVMDMSKRSNGLKGVTMKVKLGLDKSGSMGPLYRDNRIQDLLERIVPVAMSLDDDGEFDLYLFDDEVQKFGKSVNLSNLGGFVKRELSNIRMGGTNYAPIINKVIDDEYGLNSSVTSTSTNSSGGFFSSLFGSKTETKTETIVQKTVSIPSLVIFITDGSNDDKQATREALIRASNYGTFFVFIGMGDTGCTNFPFLESLDNMSGRKVDNANFFTVENLSTIDDRTLYLKLLEEVADWIAACKTQLILS